MAEVVTLENYFALFADGIIGRRQSFVSSFGVREVMYADWTASGRAYRPIEEYLESEILPFVANTHTDATVTGTRMSAAYAHARHVIRQHTGANEEDILLFCGSGMTAAVNKLQRILGLRIPERIKAYLRKDIDLTRLVDEELRPVVFVTHMEHHSNHISWLETIADVEIISGAKDGNVDLYQFRELLEKYKYRKNKIAAVTACSNVTGIQTPYYDIAELIHRQGGLCFVDFACSAPYVAIQMHPSGEVRHLDAIYFSPNKFLGGPGSPGVLIFNSRMYHNKVPDHPGGGTVVYSNPWKEHEYVSTIEEKEDGGTPPFIGAIRAAQCILLKEQMGTENILASEREILDIIFERFKNLKGVQVLEQEYRHRLGVVSFVVCAGH